MPFTKDMVPTVIATGASARVDVTVAPKAKSGDQIVARNVHPAGHTRLPRYVRGKRGTIDRDHGVFVFPDTSAYGRVIHPNISIAYGSAPRRFGGRVRRKTIESTSISGTTTSISRERLVEAHGAYSLSLRRVR